MSRGQLISSVGFLLVLLLVAAAAFFLERPVSQQAEPSTRESAGPAPAASTDEARILRAFRDRLSDHWVESHGVVDRLLHDDNVGSRHQRFILRLSSGHTVLVSHNIDLAPRIADLEVGDRVAFRGEYEWNPKGGVVH